MVAVSRMWHVTVQNMEESTSDAFRLESPRIVCKFMLADPVWREMTVEQFEVAIQTELIYAIRKVKKEMIMKGMEP